MGLKKKPTPNKVTEQLQKAKKRAAAKRTVTKTEPKIPIKVPKKKSEVPPSKINKPTDFIKLGTKATSEERDVINRKILKGELKMAFYGIDGDVGYYYYRKQGK